MSAEDPALTPTFRPGRENRKARIAVKAKSDEIAAKIIVILGYFMILVFALATVSATFDVVHKINLRQHGIQAIGTVVDVKINPLPKEKGRASTRYFSVTTKASFTSNDKIRRTVEYSKDYRANRIAEVSPDYQIADSIEIFYNSKDAAEYFIPEWDQGVDWAFLTIFLFLGPSFVYMGKNYKSLRTVMAR